MKIPRKCHIHGIQYSKTCEDTQQMPHSRNTVLKNICEDTQECHFNRIQYSKTYDKIPENATFMEYSTQKHM